MKGHALTFGSAKLGQHWNDEDDGDNRFDLIPPADPHLKVRIIYDQTFDYALSLMTNQSQNCLATGVCVACYVVNFTREWASLLFTAFFPSRRS